MHHTWTNFAVCVSCPAVSVHMYIGTWCHLGLSMTSVHALIQLVNTYYWHTYIHTCMQKYIYVWGHSFPGLHMIDLLIMPPSTQAETFWHISAKLPLIFFIGILFKTRDSACNPVLHWYMINVDPLKKIHICQLFIIIIIETFTMITIDGNTHCCRGHHPSPPPQKCADAAPTGALSC